MMISSDVSSAQLKRLGEFVYLLATDVPYGDRRAGRAIAEKYDDIIQKFYGGKLEVAIAFAPEVNTLGIIRLSQPYIHGIID